jgi:hypothetical protein
VPEIVHQPGTAKTHIHNLCGKPAFESPKQQCGRELAVLSPADYQAAQKGGS